MLSLAVASPVPIIIQSSVPPPAWTYLVPFFAALATIVAAVVAYLAARAQANGQFRIAEAQIAADRADAAAERAATEVAAERLRLNKNNAIRILIGSYLQTAAASFYAEGMNPGKNEITNNELLVSTNRLLGRVYDLEIVGGFSEDQATKVSYAVQVVEAVVTHLVQFWAKDQPDLAARKLNAAKCARACRNIANALTSLELEVLAAAVTSYAEEVETAERKLV